MEYRVLRLSRIASQLRPGRLIFVTVFWLIFVIIGAFEAKGNAGLFFFYFFEVLLIPMSILLFSAFLNTRKIRLNRDLMEFVYIQSVPTPNYRRGTKRVRVTYTVTNIENLKFDQNKLEKLFNCGHFSFEGDTVYETNSEGVIPKTSFTFYGLTHFRQTKKEICDILGVNET